MESKKGSEYGVSLSFSFYNYVIFVVKGIEVSILLLFEEKKMTCKDGRFSLSIIVFVFFQKIHQNTREN